MLEKPGFVADYEERSVDSYILVLIREDIRKFVEEHGKIKGEIQPDVDVKPARKNCILLTMRDVFLQFCSVNFGINA